MLNSVVNHQVTSNHIPSEKKSIDEFPSVSMQNKHTKSRTNASTGLPYTSCFRGVYLL